jgi:TatD DNase family protein
MLIKSQQSPRRLFNRFFFYFCAMKLVDTHTHLYLEEFDTDRDDVVKAALDAGVTAMLLPNIDSGTIERMEALSDKFPDNCFAMMGLHPTSVKDDYEKELQRIEQQLALKKYVAVGEIGIDLYWDKTYRDQQTDAFRRQLKMAKKYKLPVSIHTRDSFQETYPIVKEELTDDLKGVFHCFLGTADEAKKIMDLGFLMGVGGVITFKNSNIGAVIKDIPDNHLVFETDAPYLTPVPFRGKRNQSAYIPYILEKTAALKNVAPEELAAITTENAITLFQLKMNDNG